MADDDDGRKPPPEETAWPPRPAGSFALPRRQRAPQRRLVKGLLERCGRIDPMRRAGVLKLVLDAYRNDRAAAFGDESGGTKSDAFLFRFLIEASRWPWWRSSECATLRAELRQELTPILASREPYRSAVLGLAADPRTVDLNALLRHLKRRDGSAYNRLGVRQNAAFERFTFWADEHHQWLVVLLGVGPLLTHVGKAHATVVPTPGPPLAATAKGKVLLLGIVPLIVGTTWYVARGRDAPPQRPATSQAWRDRSPGASTATPGSARRDDAASTTTPPAHLATFHSGERVWTGRASGVDTMLTSVTWSGRRAVAVGTAGAVLVSDDGDAWQRVPQAATIAFTDVAYGDGVFVAVGSARPGTHLGRLVAVSADGMTWATNQWLERPGLNSVTYGNGAFVAVGNQGAIVRSEDSETWQTISSGTGEHLDGVSFLQGKFIVAGHGATLMTSLDGVTWSLSTQPLKGSYFAPVFGNGTYLAPGSEVGPVLARSMVLTSTDATTWKEVNVVGAGLRNAVFAGDRFVASNMAGGLLTSTDGEAWSEAVPSSALPQGGDLVWTGSRVIAVAGEGAIYVGDPEAPPAEAGIDAGP